MATATDLETGLAYDIEGAGPPVVLLHGMTFDRRTWRPVTAQLGPDVTSIAVDLPAHGDSPAGSGPTRLEGIADRVHRLLRSLDVDKPVVVGHSASAGIACLYAATYPARGVVMVDQATEILPFAQMVHQMAPMLRGPSFDQVWPRIESSLGLDLVPEPTRTLVLDTHRVEQDVVLDYWDQVLSTDPAELQAWIDARAAAVDVPCLVVLGRPATDGERDGFRRMRDVLLEQWVGDGHFVHLVDPERFAARLRAFLQYCAAHRDRRA